ncbi:MAG: helix-turn-helix transcriptional regulator [Bacillota bacterium]
MKIGKRSTRDEILELLKRHGSLSVDQMAGHLSITPMGVRQHLNILEKDGLVSCQAVRRGLGRPSHLYSLTVAAREYFPQSYESFALTLLDDLQATQGDDVVDEMFRRRAEKLAAQFKQKVSAPDLKTRVNQLAQALDENGSMTSFEEVSDDTFILNEHNCGILGVALHYPQACRYERDLFERILGARVERQECQSSGQNSCRYVISPSGSSAAD